MYDVMTLFVYCAVTGNNDGSKRRWCFITFGSCVWTTPGWSMKVQGAGVGITKKGAGAKKRQGEGARTRGEMVEQKEMAGTLLIQRPSFFW